MHKWVRHRSKYRGLTARLNCQDGFSLVEVLAAAAILALVLVPMLDFSSYLFSGRSYERQLAVTLAASKLEEAANVAYRSDMPGPYDEDLFNPFPYSTNYQPATIGNHIFRWRQTISNPFAADGSEPERYYARQIEVEVYCATCRNQAPVKVVSYLGTLYYTSTSE